MKTKTLWPFALLCCVSCSGYEVVEFRVLAIDTEEKEVPCVVLKNEDIVLEDATNQPILTPTNVRLKFHVKKDGSGRFESLKLGVRAVTLDSEGKIESGINEGDPSPYLEDSRFVYSTDAKTQLFVLRHNKDFGG